MVVVACCFLILFVNTGFASTSFNVYQTYIVQLPGVGDVGGSVVVTVRTLVSLVCMFFTGMYYRLIDTRVGVLVAMLLTSAGFAVYGLSDGMVGLCVGAALTGAGYGLGGMVASTYLIGNWFHGHVGTMAGIATMGSGAASVVVPMVAVQIVHACSLSAAFFAESAAALAIALVVFALVRSKPSDVGLAPIETEASASARRRGAKAREAVSASVPLPHSSYVAMLVAMVLLGAVSVVAFGYFGVLLTTEGVSPVLTATLLSVAGICLTGAKFAVGVVCDRFGTLRGSIAFFAVMVVALTLCCMVRAHGAAVAVAAGIMLGLGMPLGTTGISLWSLELSQPSTMLRTIRGFQVAYAFGGFAFNLLPGVLKELTGTYVTSYAMLAVMSLSCAVIVVTVYSRHMARCRAAQAA